MNWPAREPLNDLGGVYAALGARLERHEQTSVVVGRVRPAAADRKVEVVDCRILVHDFGYLTRALHHGGE
jgi:hypothetical protein